MRRSRPTSKSRVARQLTYLVFVPSFSSLDPCPSPASVQHSRRQSRRPTAEGQEAPKGLPSRSTFPYASPAGHVVRRLQAPETGPRETRASPRAFQRFRFLFRRGRPVRRLFLPAASELSTS